MQRGECYGSVRLGAHHSSRARVQVLRAQMISDDPARGGVERALAPAAGSINDSEEAQQREGLLQHHHAAATAAAAASRPRASTRATTGGVWELTREPLEEVRARAPFLSRGHSARACALSCISSCSWRICALHPILTISFGTT